jgi:hypothetical protein
MGAVAEIIFSLPNKKSALTEISALFFICLNRARGLTRLGQTPVL